MFYLHNANMAQLVEQRIRNAWVGGSSPPIGFLIESALRVHLFYWSLYIITKGGFYETCIIGKYAGGNDP